MIFAQIIFIFIFGFNQLIYSAPAYPLTTNENLPNRTLLAKSWSDYCRKIFEVPRGFLQLQNQHGFVPFENEPVEDLGHCEILDYVPFIVDKGQLANLTQSARHYADSIGLHQATKKYSHWSNICVKHLNKYVQQFDLSPSIVKYYKWISGKGPVPPFTLLPSKFPRKMFDQAMTIQPSLNLLYFRVASDLKFLQDALGELAKSDDRVREMLQIMQDVMQEGGYERQPITVNWMRADYMLHRKPDLQHSEGEEKDYAGQEMDEQFELKQIEVNAGAAGGSRFANLVTNLHRHTLSQLGLDSSPALLPDNSPNTMMHEAIHLAWLHYGDPKAVVLTVRHLKDAKFTSPLSATKKELERISGGQIQYLEIGLEEADYRLTLDPDNFLLTLDDDRRVAVVFYTFAPYPSQNSNFKRQNIEKMWRAVRTIERSTKVPTIGVHLANFKKVQQVLAKPGMVERFVPDPSEAEAIRKSFAGLWELDTDTEETKAIIQDAIANPDEYVLKPMREGGNHNFYGQQISEKLQAMDREQRATHILMERLRPSAFQNYAVVPFADGWFGRKNPEPKLMDMVTELGIYGTLVGNVRDGSVLYNRGHGYMMRSKPANSDNGGVLTGIGFYDSPYLY